MKHFSLVSNYPLFQKNFQSLWTKFQISLSWKISVLYPPKFLMTFLVTVSKFRTSPISALFTHYLISPYFSKFPPLFSFNSVFLHHLHAFFVPLLWPWCIHASCNIRIGHPCKFPRLWFCGRCRNLELMITNDTIKIMMTNSSRSDPLERKIHNDGSKDNSLLTMKLCSCINETVFVHKNRL